RNLSIVRIAPVRKPPECPYLEREVSTKHANGQSLSTIDEASPWIFCPRSFERCDAPAERIQRSRRAPLPPTAARGDRSTKPPSQTIEQAPNPTIGAALASSHLRMIAGSEISSVKGRGSGSRLGRANGS